MPEAAARQEERMYVKARFKARHVIHPKLDIELPGCVGLISLC